MQEATMSLLSAWANFYVIIGSAAAISAHYTGRAALSYATGDPYLLGSYACWRVGQYTRFGGYEGARAAREIIQDLG